MANLSPEDYKNLQDIYFLQPLREITEKMEALHEAYRDESDPSQFLHAAYALQDSTVIAKFLNDFRDFVLSAVEDNSK